MVKTYTDYHPDLGWKKFLLYGAASVPPLFVGYLRVKSLDHFPSDAGVGFMVGALCGVLVPEIHRLKSGNIGVEAFAAPCGATGLSMKWKLLQRRQK